jgi:hypothetical protein
MVGCQIGGTAGLAPDAMAQRVHPTNSIFVRYAFCVPSGIERLSASTGLATVEKMGPSSEASAASQSCGRHLRDFSRIGFRTLTSCESWPLALTAATR